MKFFHENRISFFLWSPSTTFLNWNICYRKRNKRITKSWSKRALAVLWVYYHKGRFLCKLFILKVLSYHSYNSWVIENVRHRARFWALKAKIKGVSNGLYCCYGNLFYKKDNHYLFTNVWAFVWYQYCTIMTLWNSGSTGSADPSGV